MTPNIELIERSDDPNTQHRTNRAQYDHQYRTNKALSVLVFWMKRRLEMERQNSLFQTNSVFMKITWFYTVSLWLNLSDNWMYRSIFNIILGQINWKLVYVLLKVRWIENWSMFIIVLGQMNWKLVYFQYHLRSNELKTGLCLISSHRSEHK